MSEPTAPPLATQEDEAAAVRGRATPARGMVLLTVSSGLFIVSGYATTIWLAHHLGPGDYGRYGVVMAIITLVSIAVGRGVPVAASRAIAGGAGSAEETVQIAARATFLLAVALSALIALAAVPLAAILGDKELRVPLLVGAAAAFTYGLQALSLAWFNGLHRYGRQAVAQAWYAVSRVGTIIAGGSVAGLTGAIVGSVLAPAVAALATLDGLRIRRTRSSPGRGPRSGAEGAVTPRGLLRASLPLIGVAALVSALLTFDLLAFKRVGTAGDTGRYAAAATIAHVPFFLLRSAQLVVMPAVAAAFAAAGLARSPSVRAEISHGVGDAIVILALPTALLIALGDRLLEIVFGPSYVVEGLVVAPLTLATAAITMFAVLVAVDTALGTLRTALATGLLGLVLVAAAALVGGQGSNVSRAAWAVAVAATATFVLHAISVWMRTGPFVPARALGAVGVACGLAAATLAAPDGTFWLAASAVGASAAYAAVALSAGFLRLR